MELPGRALKFEGLTEFQKDLLEVAQKEMPKEMKKVMKKVGNRGATWARREAKAKVGTQGKDYSYHKKFKSGKPFIDDEGKFVVRILNTSYHGHLIEEGHRMVTKDGREVGFVPGYHIIENAAKNLEKSGDFETLLSRGVDEMLKKKGL